MQPGAGCTFRGVLPSFSHERELFIGINLASPYAVQYILSALTGMADAGKGGV
ncbi:hypothetical protein NOY13_004786 [Enterobacter hormaechei]